MNKSDIAGIIEEYKDGLSSMEIAIIIAERINEDECGVLIE